MQQDDIRSLECPINVLVRHSDRMRSQLQVNFKNSNKKNLSQLDRQIGSKGEREAHLGGAHGGLQSREAVVKGAEDVDHALCVDFTFQERISQEARSRLEIPHCSRHLHFRKLRSGRDL